MATIKIKQNEVDARVHNNQTGTITLSVEDIYKVYVFEKAYKKFIDWTKRTHYEYGQFRTPEYNKQKGGIPTSNHLKGLAIDTYFKGVTFDKARIEKWMAKWRQISGEFGFVGEMGFYPEYSFNGCKGMLHIGMNTYSKKFTNWMTDSKGQHDNFYKL